MRRIYAAIVFGLTFNSCKGDENSSIGARSSAVGHASVSISDVWSACNNQSGLGFQRRFSAGAYYESRFLLKELSIKGAVAAFPVKAGTFGLSLTSFGFSLYSENKYNLSFAKTFGDKLSASVALDYLNIRIAGGYGNKGMFTAEAGLQAKPLKQLVFGVHVFNPQRSRISNYNNERMPTVIRVGLNYLFSEKIGLLLETEKDIAKPASIKAGLEYKVVKELVLRAGIATNPSLSSIGFGLNLKNFTIDFAASYHPLFGITPQLGLTWSSKKNTSTHPSNDQR